LILAAAYCALYTVSVGIFKFFIFLYTFCDFTRALIFTSYSLNSTWKDLIEEMPDRFMVGTDTKTGSHYDKGINNIRSGLLSNLNQETAEKVAYKNAQRLLDLH
jgi:predicted TIM-barrel fold metal-dependent hydrolase